MVEATTPSKKMTQHENGLLEVLSRCTEELCANELSDSDENDSVNGQGLDASGAYISQAKYYPFQVRVHRTRRISPFRSQASGRAQSLDCIQRDEVAMEESKREETAHS